MAHIELSRDGDIWTLTIARPEKLNALTAEMYAAISEAFREIEADGEARVGIVTGAGTQAFSAGADLVGLHGRHMEKEAGWQPWRPDRFDRGLECAKPLIAAIDGYCLAGGLELALACDIRIAAEGAQFGCPEVKWGILHGYGALRLPQMIPGAAAMEMLLTGEFIDAERARQVGLVSRVVTREALLPAARALAERIAANGPMAVQMTKELARRGGEVPLAEGLRLYQEYNRIAHASADALEGTAAFQERREPRYEGR